MKEIWKPIKDYKDYYISNLGNLKSLKFGKEVFMALSEDKDGYFKVNLFKENKSKTKYIHRLVAEAFIPNPNNLKCINHKDENKHNNSVDNLEWCTTKYNNNYGTRYFKNNRKKYIKKVLLLLENSKIKNNNIKTAINILEKLK